MKGDSHGVAAVVAGAGAERSVGERSEPKRSAAPVPAGALSDSRPDSEVVAKPQRRSYTAEYKLRILREAEAAAATRGAGRNWRCTTLRLATLACPSFRASPCPHGGNTMRIPIHL